MENGTRFEVNVELGEILYLKEDDTLGRVPFPKEGRLTKKQAEEFLVDNGIPFVEVLKVQKADFSFNVKLTDLK